MVQTFSPSATGPRNLQPLFLKPSSVAVGWVPSERSGQVGQLAGPGRAPGAAHRAAGVSGQPNGGRVLGVETYTVAADACRGARAGGRSRCRRRALRRPSDSALAKGAAGDGRHPRRGWARAAARRSAREAGAGRAGAVGGARCCRAPTAWACSTPLRPRPCLQRVPPGSIGLISQSGNLALELGMLAPAVTGSASPAFRLDRQPGRPRPGRAGRLLRRHEPTSLIAVYAEDFRDGRAFVDGAVASAGSRCCC
jgi:hypothetical protein